MSGPEETATSGSAATRQRDRSEDDQERRRRLKRKHDAEEEADKKRRAEEQASERKRKKRKKKKKKKALDSAARGPASGGGGASGAPGVEQRSNRNDLRLAARTGALVDQFFTQENRFSCVVASARNMILALTGKDIPEDQLRNELAEIAGDPGHDFTKAGINPAHGAKLLNRYGVATQPPHPVQQDELPGLTENTPITIGFTNPGHRVILDKVEKDADGNNIYVVIDSGSIYRGQPRRMTEQEFLNKWNPKAVVVIPVSVTA